MRPLASTASRAVVVDDLDLVCGGLTLLLRQAGASTVDALPSATAARSIDVDRCDIVLIGPHLAGPASQLVAGLRTRGFAGVAIHLASVVARPEFVDLLRSGVDAIVPFTIDHAELTEVLRRTLAGERVFDGVSLEAVRPALAVDRHASDMSPRERQVLALLATRRTMAEIAAELYVSVGTIKCHASNVYAKLGVRSRAEAVDRAFARRVLEVVV
ncbi:MAG: DNA-binding response regulator LuxR family [Actinomycetia bacterium]|nr:DNA-binding response regulator LuxR family [Actinomycetes bacterium]